MDWYGKVLVGNAQERYPLAHALHQGHAIIRFVWIQVQVLLSALKNSLEINVPGLFSFSAAFPSQSRSAEYNIGARA